MKFRETDPALENISDSEILMNFKSALENIYPNLIYVNAQGYDPYDAILEPLFRNMVYGVFADKYGTLIQENDCRRYEFTPSTGEIINNNHIIVIPKSAKCSIIKDGKNEILAKHEYLGKSLLFLNFGDAIHSITGGITQADANKINFNFSRCSIYDLNSKMILSEKPVWIRNDFVEFKYVSKLTE